MQNLANNRVSKNNEAVADALPAKAILASEKTQAFQQLIKLTRKLTDLAEREAQALAQNDMLTFSVLQDEKALIAEHYAQASQEFRRRLAEFRGLNPTLLDRLEDLQKHLGDITKRNNEAIERVYEQTKERAQSTLVNAQELGQRAKVKLSNEDALAGALETDLSGELTNAQR